MHSRIAEQLAALRRDLAGANVEGYERGQAEFARARLDTVRAWYPDELEPPVAVKRRWPLPPESRSKPMISARKAAVVSVSASVRVTL